MTATAPAAAPSVLPLAVTGVGVVSPAGLGLTALAAALGPAPGAEPRPSTVDQDVEMPPVSLRRVPDIRLADHLGRKGLRQLDRMTSFGLLACRAALSMADGVDPSTTGVVLATSTGSVRSSSSLGRDTLVQKKPYLVNPAQFSNTVMNAPAAQIAIWNSLRGINSTVAGGHSSGHHAIRYARTAIRLRHAVRLLVGGVEEISPPLAWAWYRSGMLGPGGALGEGCALFAVEDAVAAAERGTTTLLELLGCEVRFQPVSTGSGATLTAALAGCVSTALARSGVGPDDVDVVCVGGGAHAGLRRAEDRALRQVLARSPDRLDVVAALGECYSAGGAMQLAGLLAHWTEGRGRGRIGIVTSIGPDGNVGCLVVRKPH